MDPFEENIWKILSGVSVNKFSFVCLRFDKLSGVLNETTSG